MSALQFVLAIGGGVGVAAVSIFSFCKAAAERDRYQPPTEGDRHDCHRY